ncbi:DUF2474 domain-containing protein [Nitrobacter sp. 62-13]|jgi:hypothetical protein|nr:DUF2474 domain-containing protein [Nitrobacter sp. 62-13]
MKTALPLWKRLAWMGAIWIASVFALGVVTAVIRLFLKG